MELELGEGPQLPAEKVSVGVTYLVVVLNCCILSAWLYANLVGAQRDGTLKQGPDHRLGALRGGQGALISIEAGQIPLRWD